MSELGVNEDDDVSRLGLDLLTCSAAPAVVLLAPFPLLQRYFTGGGLQRGFVDLV